MVCAQKVQFWTNLKRIFTEPNFFYSFIHLPHGRRQRKIGSSCPSCPCPSPRCPSGKILMVIKCPLGTIHMPKCDLLNVIFAGQHRYSICDFWALSNINKQANLRLLLHVQKLRILALGGLPLAPRPEALPLNTVTSFRRTQLNKVDIWLTHQKLLLLHALALANPLLSHIPSAAHVIHSSIRSYVCTVARQWGSS